jgi:hypothetical protein
MPSTLREAINSIKTLSKRSMSNSKKKISDELLGKYKNIIPQGKTSTEFIKELRSSLYGKVKV